MDIKRKSDEKICANINWLTGYGYEEEIWPENLRKFQLVNQDMDMKRKRYKRNYGNLYGMTCDMDMKRKSNERNKRNLNWLKGYGYEEEIRRENLRKFQLVNQDMNMKRKRYKRNYGNLHRMTSDMDMKRKSN